VESAASLVPESVPRGVAKGGVAVAGALVVFWILQKVCAYSRSLCSQLRWLLNGWTQAHGVYTSAINQQVACVAGPSLSVLLVIIAAELAQLCASREGQAVI